MYKRRAGLRSGLAGLVAIACVAIGVSSASASAPNLVAAQAAAAAKQACGQDINYDSTNDASGVLKTLPASLQSHFTSWPNPVATTPWSTFKGVKGPWKIGLIMYAHAAQWDDDVQTELTTEFNAAEKKGLVTGKLVTYISPVAATETPEQQIAAIQSMVRQHVNGIMILPINGDTIGPAVTAAGKAGVPVLSIDNFIPTSKYAVNVWTNSSTHAFAGVASQVKSGNVLVVRGIVGNLTEKAFYDAATADIAACPGLKVAGTVVGGFNEATAKSAVTSFLISHPGVQINAVFEIGVMGAGVINAFSSLGKTVPPVADGGCQGGDLSWWLAHKSSYKAVGQCVNGFQSAYGEFRVLLRILGGKGLLLNSVPLPAPTVTDANIAQYATPGKSLNWSGEPRGPINALCSETCMNVFFKKPGTPGNF